MRKLSKEEVEALGLETSVSSPKGRKLSPEEVQALGLEDNYNYGSYEDSVNDINTPTDWTNSARFVGQGATFGFGDEAEAAARALDTSDGQSYDQELADIRSGMEDFETANPEMAMALEVAGAVPTMFIPMGAAANSARLATKAAQFAKVGAAEGAVTGWGHSESSVFDDPSLVLQDAAVGGVVGGSVGAAFPAIAKAGGEVTGWAGRKLEDSDAVARNEAYGIDTPLNERFPALKTFTNLLDNTSGGAVAAQRRADADNDLASDAIKDMTPDEFRSAQRTGQQIIEAADNYVDEGDARMSERFSQLRKDLDLSKRSDMSNTQKVLKEEFDRYGDNQALAGIVVPPALKRLNKAIEDGASVDALWAYKTDLGRSITTGKFGQDDVPQAKLKQLYEAVSKDLDDAVKSQLDEHEFYQYKVLMDDYENFKGEVKDLMPLLSKANRDALTPEEVVARAVRLMKDNPTRLADLMRMMTKGLDPFDGSPIDEAGLGVLFQSSLNKGQVDPQKFLDRLRIGNTKIDPVMSSVAPDSLERIRENDYWSSVAYTLNNSASQAKNIGKAYRLAERAEDSASRGSATDAVQLALSLAPAAIVGSPLLAVVQFATTYGIRQALSNPAMAKTISEVMEKASKVPASELTQQELILMSAVQAVEANQGDE
ncbi:hypothetical protein [Vibrio lentus]|uniref:hypothetical protein n=1 Tax=Vibrio lentus TaxID=136468 RepID=UPI0010BD7B0C|nr:hypothetical protein [Vibrio lentus]TKG17738.1 hypothetical protein FCW05_12590 [Vibrio lentus]